MIFFPSTERPGTKVPGRSFYRGKFSLFRGYKDGSDKNSSAFEFLVLTFIYRI